jgi:hypothetical protein
MHWMNKASSQVVEERGIQQQPTLHKIDFSSRLSFTKLMQAIFHKIDLLNSKFEAKGPFSSRLSFTKLTKFTCWKANSKQFMVLT